MSAAENEETKAQTKTVVTPEDFERWWARSEELYDVLRRLPGRLVVKAGMQHRHQVLLERWGDLETPRLDDDEIDLNLVGALRSWIHDAEIFIRYIISTEDTGTGPTTAEAGGSQMPANMPTAPRLAPVETTELAPAVTQKWHWPWVEGWDDPKKRKHILSPKEKKETSLKRRLIFAALGVGAVYAGAKYLDEE
jgi:hypothetical protein